MVWTASLGASARPTFPRNGNRGGRETVLLVTADERETRLMREILRGHGYTVLASSHAADALLTCILHVGPIHLMLTDATARDMSGRELARRLIALRPAMKTLYLVGDPRADTRMFDVPTPLLERPVTPAMLAWKVRDVLDASNESGH